MKKCQKCNKPLSGKQERWCSPRCSKLGLKSAYKKRHRTEVSEYNREYRGMSNRRPLKKSRKVNIIKNQGGQCERCGSDKELQVHHIRPLRTIGTHEPRNLMVLCDPCHKEWEKRMKGYWDKK